MADSKITALASIGTGTDPANDQLVIVDVSDVLPTGMATTGTTKRVGLNQLLSSSPTATGAFSITGLVTAGSATITGAATVGTTLGVTGVSTFAAGTALLPALTTTGDTNTGIYYPAADTFAVTTGGTERCRVDSTGNLGIGVTPSAISNVIRLEIGGALSTNLTLRSLSANASARNWMVGSNVNAFGDFVIRQGNSQGAEPNSGTDRLVIDLNGNPIFTPSSTPATLSANGQLTVNATSNTNLRFSYRGSDGVTRVANITLA